MHGQDSVGWVEGLLENRYLNELFAMWLFSVCFYYGSIFGIGNT
jgi:hypothetical protein